MRQHVLIRLHTLEVPAHISRPLEGSNICFTKLRSISSSASQLPKLFFHAERVKSAVRAAAPRRPAQSPSASASMRPLILFLLAIPSAFAFTSSSSRVTMISSALLLASSSILSLTAAAPSLQQCGAHPCGWVHYTSQAGVWTASGIQPNTFCRCATHASCRHDTTQTARSSHSVIHVYHCLDGVGGGAFPGRLAMRQHIPWAPVQDTLSWSWLLPCWIHLQYLTC